MEADKKDSGSSGFAPVSHLEERIAYRVGNKVTPRSYFLTKFIYLESDFVRTCVLLAEAL